MMRMNNAITTLVGEELEEGDNKWCATLAAPNGSVYGIPSRARRVAKFNPLDKSMTHIGPDFGDKYWKWYRGAITDSGVIYCVSGDRGRGILKIDTNTDDVTELNVNLLPEQGYGMWRSCAAALDGCIYFMPCNANRIMKLDPNNNDAMSSVGDDLGGGWQKYKGTVVGIDGCVYGIPGSSKRILKYDPINDTTSYVGEEAEDYFECNDNGALGRDGCIYAFAAKYGRVLKIDTVNNSHYFVGSDIQSDHNDVEVNVNSWGNAILGIDSCIYWPPYSARRTLKYDPYTDITSLVGADYGSQKVKWNSSALATDGVIYCIPSWFKHVLAIDPVEEFEGTTETNMQEHPEEFGSLFQTIKQADEDDSTPHVSLTSFDHAVVKFGHCKVFEIMDKTMKPVNDYCKESNLSPFMLAASYTAEGSVCVINHLLRRDLSWVNSCIGSFKGNEPKHNKRTI